METLLHYEPGKNPKSHINKKKKYKLNENFFEVPNEKNSYYAGFIAADGCIRVRKGVYVTTKTLCFGLSKKDENWLENFKKDIEYTGPIKTYESNGRKFVRMLITSNKICDDLEKNFNITPQKTFTLQPPNIVYRNLIDSYICGYIDGDGSVCFSKNRHKQKRVSISIIGTFNLLNWVLERFSEIYSTKREKNIYENKGGFGGKSGKKVYILSISDKWARTVILKVSNLNVPKMTRKWTNDIIEFCKTYKKRLPFCRRKGVNCFNLKGEFLKHYETIKEASEETGVSIGRISSLCKINDSHHMANGYMFSRELLKFPYKQNNPFARKCFNKLNG